MTEIDSLELFKKYNKSHKNILQHIESYAETTNRSHLIQRDTYVNTRGKTYPKVTLSGDFADEIIRRFDGHARIPIGTRERAALDVVEQLLGITLVRQYRILGFRVDGYCKETNTCYEVDEPQHGKPKHLEDDVERQKLIEKELGCTFVRLKVT